MKTRLAIAAISAAGLAALGGLALAAQDRSTLKVPSGLSFSEFKGYQGWEDVAVSQVPGSQKLIAANPVMMAAYKKGLPAKGQKFPNGSKVVKIEWSQKPNPDSPYAVQVPDKLKSLAFIEKDLKRFPKTNGWAYAKFDVDPKTGALKPEGTGAACGYACHTAVAAQDYIFTAYPAR
ncbi:MAG: cytochrome P460 [Phenylobacterium sp.]|nr:MAG: cytochrome P460 [Phenylobacterium sp.]